MRVWSTYIEDRVEVVVAKDESAFVAEDEDGIRADLKELAPECAALF